VTIFLGDSNGEEDIKRKREGERERREFLLVR